MCLTIPGKVLLVSGGRAKVLLSGEKRDVNLAFSQPISFNDWVLVNADLAIAKITEQEAMELINYFSVQKYV